MIRRLIYVVVPILVALLLASFANACPTCKDGIADNDPSQQAVAAGFYYSIIFMMSMPFMILGTVGSVFYFSIRKAQREREAAQ